MGELCNNAYVRFSQLYPTTFASSDIHHTPGLSRCQAVRDYLVRVPGGLFLTRD